MTAIRDKGWTSLEYIDLLCGPGIDIVDGAEHDGSPLIALKTIPAFDKLHLGDIDSENVAALQNRISPADTTRVDLSTGDCHTRAEEIVGLFRGEHSA